MSHLLHTELHWLGVPERVLYKLALMVHRCLLDKAPQYLSNYCVPVTEVASRQQLRSASRHQLLLIQRYRLRTFGRRAFASRILAVFSRQTATADLTSDVGLRLQRQ